MKEAAALSDSVTRRDLLKSGVAAAAGAWLAGAAGCASVEIRTSVSAASTDDRADASKARRKRVLRLAHLTDSHVQPERRADQGMIACLHHVQSLPDKPQLILTGGDLVMDSFEADEARLKLQWNLYMGILRGECGLPVRHCLGNHDVWGWNKKKSKTTGDEPMYGKKYALDRLDLPRPYNSFDQAGWHFVTLDSITQDGDGYLGRLNDEQFDWLGEDLARVPATTPVLIVTHIPIVAACVHFSEDKRKDPKDTRVPGAVMHLDARRLKDLFLKHRNVRLCLSGHIHQNDRVEFNGVTYICDGAVSGNWWRGRHFETDEGYGVVDLYDDGTFRHEYVTYGWKAEAT